MLNYQETVTPQVPWSPEHHKDSTMVKVAGRSGTGLADVPVCMHAQFMATKGGVWSTAQMDGNKRPNDSTR